MARPAGPSSYVWRAGQERRLALVRQWAQLDGARILDAGCGVGMYTEQFRRFSPHVTGVEVDLAVARAGAIARLPGIVVAPAEALPFADGSFDVRLLPRGDRARERRSRRPRPRCSAWRRPAAGS